MTLAITGPADECWTHIGQVKPSGYCNVWYEGRTWRAHRLAYTLLVGPIPEGLTIDHLCRNRSCCNPAHLEAVTSRENILRGNGFTAKNARKTHCANGHAFDDENTYLYKTRAGATQRQCRKCKFERNRKYYARDPEAAREAARKRGRERYAKDPEAARERAREYRARAKRNSGT